MGRGWVSLPLWTPLLVPIVSLTSSLTFCSFSPHSRGVRRRGGGGGRRQYVPGGNVGETCVRRRGGGGGRRQYVPGGNVGETDGADAEGAVAAAVSSASAVPARVRRWQQ